MPYQFKREPLTQDEATRLANACSTYIEKLVVWTLLDTGLRVSELASLTKDNLDWQLHRLMIYGKGGPYGTKSKRRIIPLSPRVQPLLEGHLALHDNFGIGARTIQRLISRWQTRQALAGRCRPICFVTRLRSQPCKKGSHSPLCKDSWAMTASQQDLLKFIAGGSH